MLFTRVPAMAPAGSSSSSSPSRRASRGVNTAGATARRSAAAATTPAAAAAMRRRQPTTSPSACSTSFFCGSYTDQSRLDVAALSASTSYSSRRGTPASSSLVSSAPRRRAVTMGNKGSTGPFAPLVVAIRNVYGTKDFNLLRGKAISLHSQVIKEFGKSIGVDTKQVQGLIRLAKKNGEKLGFLA